MLPTWTYVVTFGVPAVILAVGFYMVYRADTPPGFLLAVLIATGVFFILNIVTAQAVKRKVPYEDVTFTRSPTTLYIEYGDLSMKTQKVFAYRNYNDSSKVKVYKVLKRDPLGMACCDHLKLELKREGHKPLEVVNP